LTCSDEWSQERAETQRRHEPGEQGQLRGGGEVLDHHHRHGGEGRDRRHPHVPPRVPTSEPIDALGSDRDGRLTGVELTASLDRATYPTRVKVSNAEMKRMDLERHEVCPAWTYTISPRPTQLQD